MSVVAAAAVHEKLVAEELALLNDVEASLAPGFVLQKCLKKAG